MLPKTAKKVVCEKIRIRRSCKRFLIYFSTFYVQSVPINVLEDYNLTRMTLEYRRECRQSNVLESLTSMKAKTAENRPNNTAKEDFECTHLLRMEDDNAEIVRARSVWLFKPNHTI